MASYADKTDAELLAAMRGKQSTDFAYIEMKAELDRRVAVSALDASKAQISSARWQFWAVIAMFITAALTAWAAWSAAGAVHH
jgi:hypothetical protein